MLIGATKPEQLLDNLKTVEWELRAEEVQVLDAVSAPPRLYPHWMLDFTRLDRGDPQKLL